MTRREFFSYVRRGEELDKAIIQKLDEIIFEQRAKIIPAKNQLGFHHGARWRMLGSSDPNSESETKVVSHEEVLNYGRIVDNDLEVIVEFFTGVVEGMSSALQKQLYETLNEATEQSGNVVNARDFDSLPYAFLEMLKTIQFGVDSDGAISRPEIHMSQDQFDLFVKDAENLGEEFHLKVQEVTAQKEQDALDREGSRIGRFQQR